MLYIRKKPGWINFVKDVEELNAFIDSFQERFMERSIRKPVLGDVSQFTSHMVNILLKFIEENDNIDLYSSSDIPNDILLSRISVIEKEPLPQLLGEYNEEQYFDSLQDYQSVLLNLSTFPMQYALRATHLSKRQLNLMSNVVDAK